MTSPVKLGVVCTTKLILQTPAKMIKKSVSNALFNSAIYEIASHSWITISKAAILVKSRILVET